MNKQSLLTHTFHGEGTKNCCEVVCLCTWKLCVASEGLW